MTDSNTLPAVAKTIHLPCKKCAVDRYFVVVAHTSPTSAKVKCEVCGATKTYKLTAPKTAKATALKAPRKTKAQAAADAARVSHQDEYSKLMESVSSDAVSYNMKVKFSLNQKVNHPKFGVGFIRAVQPEKVEILFQDEIRQLVHNRQ